MKDEQTSPESHLPAGGQREPWPLPDVVRARDFMVRALSPRSVLRIEDLELLIDLDAEVARRTGTKPQALDQLLFATRRLQAQRERQIALVRRGRAHVQEAACSDGSGT